MAGVQGSLRIVGIGPGSGEHLTPAAREAIRQSDVIVGYGTYVDLVQDLLGGKEVISAGMTEEIGRAQQAVEQAEAGRQVAVISSGDAGVYGMAGLVYEVLMQRGWQPNSGIEVSVIPGISAIHSCASLLGAPVMHDACTISLSDHLTPWEVIARRLEAAAASDFVIALYNPKSGRRTRQLLEAQRILLRHRSPDTPVGLVKSAYRERQQVVLATLGDMAEREIGMLTTVIIGNSATVAYHGRMVTPRGYQRKYRLDAPDPRSPRERLQPAAEPWSLSAGASSPDFWAREALRLLEQPAPPPPSADAAPLEVAVSPGVDAKHFTPAQLRVLAEVAGGEGSLRYTPHHQLILRLPEGNGDDVRRPLQEAGLLLSPVRDAVRILACDFCDGEKADTIPHARELQRRLGGLPVPRTLNIGFNGCGMACYGAVNQDIGIVYRRGAFDLFLGGKRSGRSPHPGRLVAEGLPPEELFHQVEGILSRYREQGTDRERFHAFLERLPDAPAARTATDAGRCGS